MSNSDFQPFPKERQQQIEARQKAKQPYQSPHAPQAKVRAAGIMGSQPQNIPQQASHVPVASPTTVNPASDPEAIALELPSRFAFYDFKDLYVKPFKGLHLAKLSRAKEERSTLHITEAVSAVLSNSSGDRHLGFKLTLPDFYFVLYWLRINSFSKSKFIHTSSCSNPTHINDVAEGRKLAETLSMSEVVNKSSLQTVMLDEVPNPEVFALEYPNILLTPATMHDAIQMTEDARFVDADFRFAAQIAVYLKSDHGAVLTLDDRIRIVEDMSPDDIGVVKDYEKAVGEYGILEQIRVTCKGCGTSKLDKVQIDAHSFFP